MSRLPLPKTQVGRRRLTTWGTLLGAALAGYLATCIAYPRPIFAKGHVVSRVIGMPVDEAEQQLVALGFKVENGGEETDPEIPEGAVVWQNPPPDLVVPQGTTVSLTRSSGPAPVAVPDIADFEVDLATRVVIAAGLKVGAIDSVPGTAPAGIVVGTRPAVGSTKSPGSSVDLLVSQGPSTVEVPSLIGLDLPTARQRVEAAGFRVGRVSKAEGRRGTANSVVDQVPQGGTRAPRGGRIDLLITEGGA